MRSKALGTELHDKHKVSEKWQDMEKMGQTFPNKEFDLHNIIFMNIETGSVQGEQWMFMTYAVGWRFGEDEYVEGELVRKAYKRHVAQTERDLETNSGQARRGRVRICTQW